MPQSLEPRLLRDIGQLMQRRYSERLVEHGESVRTLGWGSVEQQRKRFEVLVRSVPLTGRSVLDIGCGFGDLCGVLEEACIPIKRYVGLDINEDLLQVARSKFPGGKFIQANLLLDCPINLQADVVVMIGLLNLRLDIIDNYLYAEAMITRAFDCCTEALAVDMLSEYRTQEYPQEDFVFYYNPPRVLEMAITLTPYVSLFHDYPAIPQREMLLVLRKTPCA